MSALRPRWPFRRSGSFLESGHEHQGPPTRLGWILDARKILPSGKKSDARPLEIYSWQRKAQTMTGLYRDTVDPVGAPATFRRRGPRIGVRDPPAALAP